MIKLSYKQEGMTPIWDKETERSISAMLNKRYLAFLVDESFSIESGISKSQIQIKVTLAKNDGTVAYPIECVHILSEGVKASKEEIAATMLDYLDAYWNEYLSDDRDVFVPLDWSKQSCETIEFYMRGFIRNLSLESQADELFRKFGTGQYEIEPISSET